MKRKGFFDLKDVFRNNGVDDPHHCHHPQDDVETIKRRVLLAHAATGRPWSAASTGVHPKVIKQS
jgi:hypothetical protein